jgi:hypothetical protein
MATREKRQINFFPDSTTGTVNITHGSNSRPQKNGFFGNGFTNTTSSSSRKRRRRRIKAEQQRRWREAQLLAQAKARAQAEAHAQARAHADAQAKAAEAKARVERARITAAHQQALELLPQAHTAKKLELEEKHASELLALPTLLGSTAQSASSSGKVQELSDAILEEKTRINYLISQKSKIAARKYQSAHSFAGIDPLEITDEQYQAILGSRSANAEQAGQVHHAWVQAYSDALDAKLHAQAVSQLQDKSTALSQRYAEVIQAENDEGLRFAQSAYASNLWSVVAGPTASSQELPSTVEKAKAVAEKLFTRKAVKLLGRALPRLALLYPTELGNTELGPLILATPASELGVAHEVDLNFIASRNETVDVTHRMALEETNGDLTHAWALADGVRVGTKVRVRSFVYNPATNAYEFTRDGETKPSLIWTPAVTPASSSTVLPGDVPEARPYSGTTPTSDSEQLGDYPTYDIEDIEDYIVVFPKDSGLKPFYIYFNQRVGDHQYYSKPKTLPAFPEAVQTQGKTRVQGGGTVRPRWKDISGHIYEWDFRHGTVEKYNKRGVHLGEFDPETGMQTKKADPSRRVEP